MFEYWKARAAKRSLASFLIHGSKISSCIDLLRFHCAIHAFLGLQGKYISSDYLIISSAEDLVAWARQIEEQIEEHTIRYGKTLRLDDFHALCHTILWLRCQCWLFKEK